MEVGMKKLPREDAFKVCCVSSRLVVEWGGKNKMNITSALSLRVVRSLQSLEEDRKKSIFRFILKRATAWQHLGNKLCSEIQFELKAIMC